MIINIILILMSASGVKKIKPQNTDDKGMIDGESMIYFLEKAKISICKIYLTKGFGSGFFCKIPYTEDNNHLNPALITCNHVLSKDLIKQNNINIILNSQDKTISLNQRKIWTDEKIDFTCIEIKEKEDNIYTFFNLDDNVFTNELYLNQNVINNHLPKVESSNSYQLLGQNYMNLNGEINQNYNNNYDFLSNTNYNINTQNINDIRFNQQYS